MKSSKSSFNDNDNTGSLIKAAPSKNPLTSPIMAAGAVCFVGTLGLWVFRDAENIVLGAIIWLGVLSTVTLWALLAIWRNLSVRLDGLMETQNQLRKAIADTAMTSPQKSENLISDIRPELDALQDELQSLRQELRTLTTDPLPSTAAQQPAFAVIDNDAVPSRTEKQESFETLAPAFASPSDLTSPEFIAAMNFPLDENDRLGFEIFEKALAHPTTAQVLRSAQDVLTFLAEEGIYTDDLRPDYARATLWRQFAEGERGRAITEIGGIRDRECLAKVMKRMRSDNVFRDSVHHFLRHFDKALGRFVQTASDADLITLSDTRTARAFMLLGRVAGTFD